MTGTPLGQAPDISSEDRSPGDHPMAMCNVAGDDAEIMCYIPSILLLMANNVRPNDG
jgi:hypothetical protein